MEKRLSRLRYQLTLLVLIGLLPVLGMVYLTDMSQRRSASARAREEVLRLARLAAAEQEQLLEYGHQLLVALTQLPAVQYRNAAGCDVFLVDLLEQYPFYSSFAAATPEGNVFCSAPPTTAPVNLSDLGWFQRLAQNKNHVISGYQIGPISGKPVVIMAHPVLNAAGEVQAIVTAGLDLAWFNDLASEAQLPAGSDFTVIDHNGTVLARAPDGTDWAGRSVADVSLVQTVLAQGEGMAEAKGLDGVTRQYAFTMLSTSQDLGAYVAVGIPSDVVFANANRVLAGSLAALAVAALLGLVAAGVGGQRFILKPMQALLATTERLAAGDLKARTKLPPDRGELSQLARAFDHMAGAMERREEELRRANRALKTISECNQTLVRATDEFDLLQTVCQIVVEIGGYRLAWVGYAQQDEAKSIRPVAQAGSEDGYLDMLDLTWADGERGRGPAGTAIRTGEPAIARDIETDPTFGPWREQALARGYASSIALPLRVEERVVGTLNVYAAEPDALHGEEVSLLLELADDLAFGIAALRTRAARRQAEQALREGEARYRLLFESAPVGIFSADPQGQIVEVNPQALEIVGSPSVEAIRAINVLSCPPLVESGFSDDFRRCVETGESIIATRHYNSQWNKQVYARYHLTPILEQDGRVVLVQTMLEDITDQMEAQQARRESEERYHSLVENLPVGVYRRAPGPDGAFSVVNPAFRAIFGLPSEHEVGGIDRRDLYQDPDDARAFYDRLMAEGRVTGAELPLKRLDGTPIWAHVTAQVHYDAGTGEPAYVDGTVFDVTRQVGAEREQQKLAVLVENSMELVGLSTLRGEIVFLNEAGARMLGVAPDRLGDYDIPGFLPEPYREQLQAEILPTVMKEGSWQGDLQYLNAATGKRVDVSAMIFAVPDPQSGNPALFANVSADITERKRMERASAERQMRLVLVNQIATGIRSGASLHEIITQTVEQTSDYFPGLRVAYSTTDDRGRLKVVQSCQPAGTPSLTGWEINVADDAPKFIEAMWGDELVVVPDVANDPDLAQLSGVAQDRGIGSLLAVPLRHSKELVGVLSFDSATPHGWTEHETTTLAAIADVLAVAVRDAQLREERRRSREQLQQYAERLSALHAIDTAILGALSPHELVQGALQHIQRLVPCLGAGVLTFDHKAKESVLLAVDASNEGHLVPGTRFPLVDYPEMEALETGQTLQVSDFEPSLQTPSLFQFLQNVNVRSFIAAPLVVQDELIGCMGLGWARPNGFTPEQAAVVREVSNQVAVGLHQARLRLALEAEEQRLQALVDNLPEGILLLDDAYRVLFSNPTARDYLSILEKEGGDEGLTHLAGRPLEELLQPRPQGLQHELNAPGPPARIFELTTRSIAKGSGVEGWLLLMRDVTAEREFQDRIQQQDRLAAVGQLAAGIAHDFNNIMATVVLYSSILLRSDDLSDKERERLAIIGQQGHRAANLVQQILDFARKSVLERTPLDLVPFLKELEKLLARTLPENIHLRLTYGDADYVVNADPTRVQQVIMNLALNARDAMPRGGELCFALSHLKLGPKDPPPLPEMSAGEWVRFEVSDTGMGIPPENRPHIFEPFFTTKERGKGTGLGLAQVHGIVAQHEGYIDLETQVGHGTTFTIYLPAFSRMPAMMEGSQMGALAEGQGETILVVEDDPNTRAAISETLELLGYAVVTATNGEEALAVFDAHSAEIALVLTDLVMPRMGGVELRALLAGKHPGVKVVAVTGYPLEEEGKSLLEQGIAAWISKPFSTEQLAQTLREVLRG